MVAVVDVLTVQTMAHSETQGRFMTRRQAEFCRLPTSYMPWFLAALVLLIYKILQNVIWRFAMWPFGDMILGLVGHAW